MKTIRLLAVFGTMICQLLFCSQTYAAADTSLYGAWNDILSPQQAVGRFQWLERCYKGLLIESWDKMYDSTAIVPAEEKIRQLRDAWLYENGELKQFPNYLTFGNTDHQNPREWYAGTSNNESCKSLPTDYQIMGLMTSLNYKNYCTNKAQEAEYEWIARVELSNIDSQSDARTYTHFSGRVIKLSAGQQYQLSLTPGFSEEAFPEYFRVWIDWNNNGNFTDDGEFVLEEVKEARFTKTITVPQNAQKGLTRMRVAMDLIGGSDNPCRHIQWGEVEDYAVLIK